MGNAVPILHAGYGAAGRYTAWPGISPDGLWAKVGGMDLPLSTLLQSILDTPLIIERFEEPGEDDYPRRIALRARRPPRFGLRHRDLQECSGASSRVGPGRSLVVRSR
jgi:hypothetical protein